MQRHFKLDPRRSLIENLNAISIMLDDKHDHSFHIQAVLTHAHLPPVTEKHAQRLCFKIVIEHWLAGELESMDPKAVLERAENYLTAMPWLTQESIEEGEDKGPSTDLIRGYVMEERKKDEQASWKAIAERIASVHNIDFWTVYPKALAVKRALIVPVAEVEILDAPTKQIRNEEETPVAEEKPKRSRRKR